VRGISERAIASRFLDELPREHVQFSDQSGWQEAGWDIPGGVRGERAGAAASPSRGVSGGRSSVQGFRVGMRVRHPQFGLGEIIGLTGGGDARAQVRFRDVGVKTLVLQYARLEKVGGE
jgi:DNA helicase-2/ATP-dependent DNA helicase PcrA